MKQYNKNKLDKWGYKVFVLSEAISGYVLKFTPYVGKVPGEENNDGILHSHRVVRNLMNSFRGKGHELYIDSYYTGIELAEELVESQIRVCGTVNTNRRNIPSAMKGRNLHLERGDKPFFMQRGRLLLYAWQDTKRVTMLSSIHTNECTEKAIRSKSAEGGVRTVKVPKAVADYNCFMGGADLSSQRMKTYLFPHCSRKWYPRIVNCILSICMVNANILFNSVSDQPMSLKSFIKSICISLLEGHRTTSRRPGRPILGDVPLRLTERHWLEPSEGRADCVV